MIKFFRTIRQKLLQDNKVSKYLIYALGEILLVVVGILLALQINNWNEKVKTRKQELVILENILRDLVLTPYKTGQKSENGLVTVKLGEYDKNKKSIYTRRKTESFAGGRTRRLHGDVS